MAKVRITLTEEQLEEVVSALYRVGSPLGDRFAKLVDAVEASKKVEMEAAVADDARERRREVEELFSVFGKAFR